jgi:hypothetical protein
MNESGLLARVQQSGNRPGRAVQIKEKTCANGFGSLKGKISAKDIAHEDIAKVVCKKDGAQAKLTTIGSYEYEPGIPLQNVPTFECPKCHEFIFTPEQVEDMEARTDKIKAHSFAFERKITISGRSLSINLPEDLVKHMKLLKGKSLRLTPIDDKRFMAEMV